MYIGEVAKSTGLSVKAIRLYEARGLITAPPRQGRYRVYNKSHVEVLLLIVEAKALGATLAELKGALIYNNGALDWSRVHGFLAEIKNKLLTQQSDILKRIDAVERCISTLDSCPHIQHA